MSTGRGRQADNAALKKLEELDLGSIVVSTATSVVKNRPVSVSIWALGLLLAAFAGGFSVDDLTLEQYQASMQHADEVTSKDLHRAYKAQQKAQQQYDNVAGWFSCDTPCQRAKDRLGMAKEETNRVEALRQRILTDARREVGIWSYIGVQHVRDAFWSAWKSGKDMAARMTMWDAIMLAMPGSREESMVSMLIKLVFQYIMNLTIGLMFSMGYFVYNVYTLVVAYGESVVSGTAFFLLVVVAAFATVGTYIMALTGTVAGGTLFLAKQAAKNAALEGGRAGGAHRQVRYDAYGGHGRPGYGQYGTGRVGGAGVYRPHSD